ncbi:MAG: RNA polymerase sigma factor RpoS [bacterium ADurb.Bin400]|nr:MAG: RNA polymerase sigma factor RpoS [bacterium ADurb.Bin400]
MVTTMTIKNFSPYNIVKDALTELRDNEKKVVSGRFGIDTPRKTLSSIGKDLRLSRERVRQIEKEGLAKLSEAIVERQGGYIERIIKLFEKYGGITATHKIPEKFLEAAYQGDPNQFNSMVLIFHLVPNLKKIKKTREIEDSWMLAHISRDDAVRIIDDWVGHLKKIKKPATIEILVDAHPHHQKYEMTFLSELPSISKKLIQTDSGHVGLSTWSEINPRNVRDKIYYVLKKMNRPMHFEEIAKKIHEQKFDRKRVVKATVHNELIADKRFILVGRGIYALREWGYEMGTVADVIKSVLDGNNEGLGVDEIIKEVLKRRVVKKNTILINLKTKSDFVRVGEDRYALSTKS